jgi:hypothetical protein
LNVLIASQGIGRRKIMKKENEPENPSWVDEIIKLEEEGKNPSTQKTNGKNNTDI